MHERIAKNRQEMERIARSELQHLQQSLRESSNAVLNTMASDIAAQSQAARQRITASLNGLEQRTERWRNVLGLVLLRNACIDLAIGEPSGRGDAMERPAGRVQCAGHGPGAQDLGNLTDAGPERALHHPAARGVVTALSDPRQTPSPAPGVNHERTGIVSSECAGQVGEPRSRRACNAESS